MNGTIIRLVPEKGFGFIRGDDASGQEYFFHRTALGRVDFSALHGGERVSFQEEPSAKGPRACAVEVL